MTPVRLKSLLAGTAVIFSDNVRTVRERHFAVR